MKWLWSEWPQVEGRIWSSGHTVLLLDYDGTLAPIARVPEEARVPAPMKSLLRRLSRSSRVTVALISGRPLANLRQLVGVRNLTYVGNHGLEMWHRGRCTSVAVPGRSREALSRIRPTLAGLVKDVPGARLEDKGCRSPSTTGSRPRAMWLVSRPGFGARRFRLFGQGGCPSSVGGRSSRFALGSTGRKAMRPSAW